MVQTNESPGRPLIRFGENMRITVAANQGGRRYMEDRCLIHTERGDHGELLWTFVGVFDGHGGEHASEYVRRHLLMNITRMAKFESRDDEDILEAIRQGFLVTHDEMRNAYEEWPYTASGYPSTAGTTVSVVFIRNGNLYTGHCGDSAIYLGSVENGELHCQPLTVDHKPESGVEQLRIAKAGGETAVKSGVTRVVWKRPQKGYEYGAFRRNPPYESIPFLSVARSLGDLWSFNPETNMFVVSPEPDLGVHKLTGNDFCLVLASDGMTNVLSGEQAVSIVFKEEEYLEMGEANRNHSRCVLRAALQKWRSLRADNVTVATVIFDIHSMEYDDNEKLTTLSRYHNVSQALTDRQDAMLHVTPKENVMLATQRCPIIYNGSKDVNYCRVAYRGPGFRSHEEEIAEERRNLMNKFTNGAVGDKEEDIWDDEEEEDDGPFNPAEEIDLSMRFTSDTKSLTLLPTPNRPPRPHAPMPVFINESTFDPLENSEDVEPKSEDVIRNPEDVKLPTPSKTPPGHTVRRVKAEAVRRLRTPRIISASTSAVSTSSATSPERRVTRSVSRSASHLDDMKTPSPLKKNSPDGVKIGVNCSISPSTPRRSERLAGGLLTPMGNGLEEGSVAKLTMSRKRGRTDSSSSSSTTTTHSRFTMVSTTTGVTPIVSSLSIQDCNFSKITSIPSKSAPSTPKKERIPSKWSLSKLDFQKNGEKTEKMADEDGIIRVSEVADEIDEEAEIMREPPSKIRRFYGYMRKFIWGK